MMAIAAYDRAHDDDLARGRTIAGTGTINADGDVGTVASSRRFAPPSTRERMCFSFRPRTRRRHDPSPANGCESRSSHRSTTRWRHFAAEPDYPFDWPQLHWSTSPVSCWRAARKDPSSVRRRTVSPACRLSSPWGRSAPGYADAATGLGDVGGASAAVPEEGRCQRCVNDRRQLLIRWASSRLPCSAPLRLSAWALRKNSASSESPDRSASLM